MKLSLLLLLLSFFIFKTSLMLLKSPLKFSTPRVSRRKLKSQVKRVVSET